MRDGLIQTDNVIRGLSALNELKRQHQVSPGRNLMVFEGLTGRGKTSFTEWYAVQDFKAVYLEANADWTSSWLMRDVAEALKLTREHSIETNYRQIKEAQRRTPRLLLIDEADRIIRSGRLLETVRGLHDAGMAIVLVAEAGAWGGITRKSPRFADRVCQVVEFGDVTAQEIEAAALELADLRLTPELAAYVKQQAEGNFRRAAKIVEELERVCKANPGEITRNLVNLAVANLKIAEERDRRRAARRAAAG